ncbi:pentapeptide repeat protein [Rhodobacter aestuarii]|uniref:Pentapeptide repeat-containing protein n=1 Tax=Rhodobacter aestuarii TaxID=453582 RepID=A0A1N7PBU0_9RHOB|nr:pentapeptide repeat-containing protein [Rhodobacter aestuarii]PTV97722.1 pentapeptide repeat protein [Rhodobacter aestuarii]SIT07967.1 Pentapeptide repeat-containing protein [Rhodobacter aestuarii]
MPGSKRFKAQKRLFLRQATQHPAPGLRPAKTAHPAHMAGGREITNGWAWFERVVLMATLVSVIFGIWAWKEEHDTRREEAINRAWSILTAPATGNSGKREALEYLAAQGVSLRGIDLSCEKMGGGWDEAQKACDNPVDLMRLTPKAPEGERVDLYRAHLQGAKLLLAHLAGGNLGEAHLEGADLRVAHLEGAGLFEAHLEAARLGGAYLQKASLRETHLEGAALWEAQMEGADLRGAHLEEASLWKAQMEGADLSYAHLDRAQISGADFNKVVGLDTAHFTDVWAWADSPPIGLPATIPVTLCQYRDGMARYLEPFFIRPDPCLPPD